MAISSKYWLGFILDKRGNSYYVDSKGVVQLDATPTPLKHMPAEWQDFEINYGVSGKYFALERTYTNSYTFYKDAAKIIRHALYKRKGADEKLYFALLKWNDTNNVYEVYYKAEFELNNCTDTSIKGIETSMMEAGFAQLLKTNQNTQYDIPVDELTVNNDGVLFNDTFNYFLPANPTKASRQQVIDVTFISNDGLSIGAIKGNQDFALVDDPSLYMSESPNYFFGIDTYTQIEIVGEITLEVAFAGVIGTSTPAVEFFVNAGVPYTPFVSIAKVFFDDVLGYKKTFSINTTVHVGNNMQSELGKCFLFRTGNMLGFSPAEIIQTGDLKVKFKTRYKKTQLPALRPLTLLQRLISKATNNQYQLESSLLDNNNFLTATSGVALRGEQNPVIKTSINEFLDSYGKILGGALRFRYTDNKVYLEKRNYFYDINTQMVDIGEVADFTIEVANERRFSKIKVGYTSQKEDNYVARQAIHATQIYTTDVENIEKELDLVCKYIADPFTIEQVRSQFGSREKTDSKQDNATFILNINRTPELDGSYNLYRDTYTIIDGIDNANTMYNIDSLTPKHILLNNSDMFGYLYKLPQSLIRFTSADKNANFSYETAAGAKLSQNSNVTVGSLQQSFYKPYVFKFKTKVPSNILNLLQNSGKGFIGFTFNGIAFKGFVEKVSVKPIYQDVQEWQLLCCSDIDTTTFATLNNQFITIENKGMISHNLPVKIIPLNSSYPLQYHLRTMDADWHKNRIGRFGKMPIYTQKWQTNDSFDLQFITEGLSVTAEIIDCNATVVQTITMGVITNPAITNPMQCYQGTVNCSLLAPNAIYYGLFTFGVGFGAKQFITEPMEVKDDWPKTILIEGKNENITKDLVWNAPFTTKFRVEGNIEKFNPDSKFTNFVDTPANTTFIEGIATRGYTLFIGDGFGVPDWVLDKVNRMLLLDETKIEGVSYALAESAKFELVDLLGTPYTFATIKIVESKNTLGLSIDADGMQQGDITVMYNINTKGFSSENSPNVNQQNNIIQVTDVE